MSKSRKKFARLGKVLPAVSVTANPKPWSVKADSKCLHFQQLWARDGAIQIPIADVLDFAINRKFVSGDRQFRIGLCGSGISIREAGCPKDVIITFPDLLALLQGQSIAFPLTS